MFFFSRPDQLYRLRKCYLQTGSAQSFLNWFANKAPVVWHKPDIFHLQWAKAVEEWIFLKEFGIKVVVSLRGAHINYSPLADKALAASYTTAFPKVDAFHGVSEAICLEAEKYGAVPQKCKVVYSGLKLDDFRFQEKKDFGSNKIKILSVGRAHWKKGYNFALDAMKQLKDQGVDFEYRIIGGKNEELIFQVSDLGLKEEVSLEENIPFEEVRSAMSNADALLLPSVEEGIPNVVLEAMALGTIVLSTDCGGVSEVIEDGQNGFLAPIRNSSAISEKITALTRFSQSDLDRIRSRARETIESQHHHQKMVEDMIDLYRSVV